MSNSQVVRKILDAMHTIGVAVTGAYPIDGDKSFAEALNIAIDVEDEEVRNLIRDLAREVRTMRQTRAKISRAYDAGVVYLKEAIEMLEIKP